VVSTESRRRTRRVLGLAVGATLSAFFSYLAVRAIDFKVFREGLAESNYVWLVPAFALLLVGIAIRAVRWQLLFSPEGRPPLGVTIRALLVGQFLNSILPARAGEAARIIFLHREARTSRAEAAGTAIAERVFDVIGLLLLFFVFLPFLPEIAWLRRAAVAALVISLIVLAGVIVLVRFGVRAVRLVLRPFRRLPRVSAAKTDEIAERLTQGLGALHRPAMAIVAFVLTVVSWLIFAAAFWLVSIGFDLPFGYAGGMLVMVTTSLVLVVPSLPGAIGTFEAATVVALRAYGVGDSQALAYAVVLHALNLIPFIAIGLALLHGHVRRGVTG
jgi:uncharacterized protein (TIRG00374 family)